MPGRPPVRAAREDAARPPRDPGALAARLLAAERDLGGRDRPLLRVRRLHQSRRARRSPPTTASATRPSTADRAPRTAVAVWAICAETDEQAQYLASSSRMSMRLLRQGQLIPVPPPEKALEYLRAIGQPTDHGFTDGRRGIIGSPETVRAEAVRGRRRLRRRGGDRRDDHLRPRGAQALLRADRRGGRARAAGRR